jgi:hypothetical protein
VFSNRNRDELLKWLDDIEQAVPEDHRRLVEEVYGSDWLEPYREMFGSDESTL